MLSLADTKTHTVAIDMILLDISHKTILFFCFGNTVLMDYHANRDLDCECVGVHVHIVVCMC